MLGKMCIEISVKMISNIKRRFGLGVFVSFIFLMKQSSEAAILNLVPSANQDYFEYNICYLGRCFKEYLHGRCTSEKLKWKAANANDSFTS